MYIVGMLSLLYYVIEVTLCDLMMPGQIKRGSLGIKLNHVTIWKRVAMTDWDNLTKQNIPLRKTSIPRCSDQEGALLFE